MIKKCLMLFTIACLLSSCNTTHLPPKEDISFTKYQPISLDVSTIETVDAYQSPMKAPNVEYLLPYSPTDAMHIWVKDRLRAVGQQKTLQVIIKDGSIISTELQQPDSSGVMVNTGVRRYDAKLEVELRIYGGDAMSEASIEVTATQNNTLAENVSLAQRDVFFRHLELQLMDSANAELERQIFKYFPNYISYAQTP